MAKENAACPSIGAIEYCRGRVFSTERPMQPQTTLIKFDSMTKLRKYWASGLSPGEDGPDLKAALDVHLDAHGAKLRGNADCAAVVTAMLLVADDEDAPERLLDHLLEASAAWVSSWAGSPPLASRIGPITARHLAGPGRKRRAVPRGLAIELVVAPVRSQRHRSGSTSKQVSLNKALIELTEITLGPGSASRHAEALATSWRRYLADALPDLDLAERAPSPRELRDRVLTLEEIVANVPSLRERHDALETTRAEHEAQVVRFQAFPQQVEVVLSLIDREVIYLKEEKGIGFRAGDAELRGVAQHFRRHIEVYRAVLMNPGLSEGVRLSLTIILGELDQTWGTPANQDAVPRDEVDQASADLADEDIATGDGTTDGRREVS